MGIERNRGLVACFVVLAMGCGGAPTSHDAGAATDAGFAADSGTPVDGGEVSDAGGVADAGFVDSGAGDDAGATPDAGAPADAGAIPDAGLPADGSVGDDAGLSEDAGAEPDAGEDADAGNPTDAGIGPDAGSPDGGRLSDLSDFFDHPPLNGSWSIHRPELVSATVSDGALGLELTGYALWFDESEGPSVYKNVTGNFKVTATVHARKASNTAEPPSDYVHLGGLMARNPTGDGPGPNENYVFIVIGWDEQDLSVETKTTRDGQSTYVGPAWPSGDAELRLCRVGTDLYLFKRALGAPTWELAASYPRDDLPPTLQVGPLLYAPATTPDLRVTFDQIVFSEVTDRPGCED